MALVSIIQMYAFSYLPYVTSTSTTNSINSTISNTSISPSLSLAHKHRVFSSSISSNMTSYNPLNRYSTLPTSSTSSISSSSTTLGINSSLSNHLPEYKSSFTRISTNSEPNNTQTQSYSSSYSQSTHIFSILSTTLTHISQTISLWIQPFQQNHHTTIQDFNESMPMIHLPSDFKPQIGQVITSDPNLRILEQRQQFIDDNNNNNNNENENDDEEYEE